MGVARGRALMAGRWTWLVRWWCVCCVLLCAGGTVDNGYLWSVQPTSDAVLGHDAGGAWVDVADSAVRFSLSGEHTVRVSYQATVIADKAYLPGGGFVGQPLEDMLAMRVVVHGLAFRQSGSHTNPLGIVEQARSSLLGHFVGELGAGDHVVQLQWRRWGSGVRALQSVGRCSTGTGRAAGAA